MAYYSRQPGMETKSWTAPYAATGLKGGVTLWEWIHLPPNDVLPLAAQTFCIEIRFQGRHVGVRQNNAVPLA
jgi:hypothetical protein